MSYFASTFVFTLIFFRPYCCLFAMQIGFQHTGTKLLYCAEVTCPQLQLALLFKIYTFTRNVLFGTATHNSANATSFAVFMHMLVHPSNFCFNPQCGKLPTQNYLHLFSIAAASMPLAVCVYSPYFNRTVFSFVAALWKSLQFYSRALA